VQHNGGRFGIDSDAGGGSIGRLGARRAQRVHAGGAPTPNAGGRATGGYSTAVWSDLSTSRVFVCTDGTGYRGRSVNARGWPAWEGTIPTGVGAAESVADHPDQRPTARMVLQRCTSGAPVRPATASSPLPHRRAHGRTSRPSSPSSEVTSTPRDSFRIGCSILADNSVIRHVSGQQRVHPVHAASPLAAEHQSRAAL